MITEALVNKPILQIQILIKQRSEKSTAEINLHTKIRTNQILNHTTGHWNYPKNSCKFSTRNYKILYRKHELRTFSRDKSRLQDEIKKVKGEQQKRQNAE